MPCIDHHHVTHTIDLTATLKSELAAANYKRDRLMNEIADLKGNLNARDAECETLRTQTARQSALISSLQSKVHAIENRERSAQNRSENAIQTLQREKKVMDDRIKDLVARVRRLEGDLSAEESQREQTRSASNHKRGCYIDISKTLCASIENLLIFLMVHFVLCLFLCVYFFFQSSVPRFSSSALRLLGYRCIR